MELPPLPEGSAVRVSADGDAAVLEWTDRSALLGRRTLPSLAISLLVLCAAVTGYFDAWYCRAVMAALLLIQVWAGARVPGPWPFRSLLPSLLSAGLVCASVVRDGTGGRILLASGMGLLFLPSLLGLFRAPVAFRLRIEPDAMVWPAFPDRRIRRGELLGSRKVGTIPWFKLHTPWLKAELPVPGSLGEADSEWIRRVLEGWKAGVTTPPAFLDLAPFPPGGRLAAEDAGGLLRIQWGVKGGELRRKVRVLAYLALMLAACGIVLPYTRAWRFSVSDLSGLGIQLLMAWGAWKLLGRETYRLAHATGHAELTLDGVGMTLDPGAGLALQSAGRGEIAAVRTEGGRVLLSCASRKRPLALSLPAEPEAAWVADTIERWRAKPA